MNLLKRYVMALLGLISSHMSCQTFIISCLFLSACAQNQVTKTDISLHSWKNAPSLTKDSLIKLGGQSGLHYLGKNKSGLMQFLTLTDRGPNLEMKNGRRPFLDPNFTPQVMLLTLNKHGEVEVSKRILLKDTKGKPLTGLPNIESDEIPVNESGKLLKRDLMGGDFEGVTVDESGDMWLVEEYRPSIFHFSSKGILKHRFIPEGVFSDTELKLLEKRYGKNVVIDSLPKELAARRPNRGFEGVTYHNGILYAVLQSPLIKGEDKVPLLEFDTKKMQTLNLGHYTLTDTNVEKIGDMTYSDGSLYLFQQNGKTGKKAIQQIVRIERDGPHEWSAKEMWSISSGKVRELEKIEGLVRLSDGRFVLVNDNDFALEQKVDNYLIFATPKL